MNRLVNCSIPNSASACARPACPIRSAASRFVNIVRNAATHAPISPAGTVNPVSPCRTTSANPPTALATTAVPRICASAAVSPNGSCHFDGTACTHAPANLVSIASRDRCPVNSTFGPAWASNAIRSGPSPAKTNLASGNALAASTKTCAPFSRTNRPANTASGGPVKVGRCGRVSTPQGITIRASHPHSPSARWTYPLLATISRKAPFRSRNLCNPQESGSQSCTGTHRSRKHAAPARCVQASPFGNTRVPVRQIGRYHCAWYTDGTSASTGKTDGDNCVKNIATCTTSGRNSAIARRNAPAAIGLANCTNPRSFPVVPKHSRSASAAPTELDSQLTVCPCRRNSSRWLASSRSTPPEPSL